MPNTAQRSRRQSAHPRRETRTSRQVKAVIFLGADAVSMMVAEHCGDEVRVLDVLSQPVGLAHDVFRGSVISRDTMDRCVQIAQGYHELLAEYRLAGPVEVRLLATNILLDVRNMDTLVNRLQITCGLQLEVMDDGEMTRLLYLNTRALLDRHEELVEKQVLVLHVGPGNTRFLLFDKGRISYYASYRMGAHRTGLAIGDAAELAGVESESSLIREHIRGIMEQVVYDIEDDLPAPPDALIIFGPDFHVISSPLVQGDCVTTEQLAHLAHEIAATPPAQRQRRYKEDYASVCALLPAALIYLAVARDLEPRSILCPAEEFSHAFLRNLMPGRHDDLALEDEVVHFSVLLANHYRVDKAHGQQIRRLTMLLFDQLQELHGLTRHDRLLLKVAAILHEVGSYINPKKHHHHSQYIILNSEIFGLSRADVEVVGLLARYHRHGAPTTAEPTYALLNQTDRLRVQKLAALLRVAEAMERAHSRRIRSFTVRTANRRLELIVPDVADLTLENMALRSKGAMFTDIFGYDIILLPAGAARSA
ncbi:MAG: HD domain-containing protein [Akkermansia sp.]|nr:HD domain-containing protein [Akkermansia sp.]